jgi:O-antigen/teichoic acid export membrane protein
MPSLLQRVSLENTRINKYVRLSRELLWIAGGQGAALMGGILGVRLLTGAMNPNNYGILALSVTIATLFQQVILSPIAVAALRFFAPAKEANQLRLFLKGARKLISGASFVSLGLTILLLGIAYWAGLSQWFSLILGALAYSLFTGYSIILDGIQNAARNRAVVAWHQALGQWLRFAIALVFIRWFGSSGASAIWGYGLAAIFVFASQYCFFKLKIEHSDRSEPCAGALVRKHVAEMARYAWPFAAWGIFTWAQMASDRWALQTFSGTREVGLYTALYQIGYYPVSLMSGWLVQLMTPILFARAGEGSDIKRVMEAKSLNDRLVAAAVTLTALATALAYFLHTLVFRLFVAQQYHSVSGLLPWMILSGGLFACSQIAVSSLLCRTESRSLLWPKVVTSVLGVLLNFAGARFYGLQGIVGAGVLFSATYFVWVVCITRPFLLDDKKESIKLWAQ